jgi:thiol-disulfide isomerase/thioredoxin
LRAVLVGTLVRFSLEPRGSEWVVASIDPIRTPAVRAVAAPDFTLPALSGGSVRLADLRGKAVVVNFWATWCVPCRAEMPTLEDLYRRYKGEGLEVLAVNLDRLSVAGVEAFMREVKLSFPILLDPDWSTTRLYGVMGLPTTYLVDRTGQVVVREVGERDWTDEVARAAVSRLLH